LNHSSPPQFFFRGKQPDVRPYARVIEKALRQSDDSFQEISFQEKASNLALPTRGAAHVERRSREDDRDSAASMLARLAMGEQVLEKEELAIGYFR
jgi:hypothetical protein